MKTFFKDSHSRQENKNIDEEFSQFRAKINFEIAN